MRLLPWHSTPEVGALTVATDLEAIPKDEFISAGPALPTLDPSGEENETFGEMLLDVTGYHVWWIAFVATAYFLPKRFGIPGVLLAHVLTATCAADGATYAQT
jgi:hypothetical protein